MNTGKTLFAKLMDFLPRTALSRIVERHGGKRYVKKMHILLDLRGNIPSFIHISDGKLGDVNVLDILELDTGAIYIMDRGYLDFAWFYVLHLAQAFFVTRAKSNTRLKRVYSAQVDHSAGIICDQTVTLTSTTSRKDYREHLRGIGCKIAETGKSLIFLTKFHLASIDNLRALQCMLAGEAVL